MKQYKITARTYTEEDNLPECYLADDDPAQELIEEQEQESAEAFNISVGYTDED